MYNVSIDFEGHKVTGWADLCGPHAECEGSEVTSVTPANSDKDFRDRALRAVEADALRQHNKAFEGHYSPSDYDHRDDYDSYDSYCSGQGGDYWISEDGEYRCG